MAKQNKGRRRRKNSKHYSDSDDEHLSGDDDGVVTKDSKSCKNNRSNKSNSKSELSFAERRDLQRKAAAEKRRQKMKCYLCGKTGHVRRECPGIADDGRGESKYTKSHGDAGAVHLKQKGRKKHNNNNGDHGRDSDLVLPPGFDKQQSLSDSSFFYYDAAFGDGQSILEYLRFGRHGHGGKKSHNNHNTHNHTKISRKDAISEYDTAMKGVCDATNFGGCIVRSFLPLPASATTTAAAATTTTTTEEQPWNPQDSFPFSWSQEMPELLKFVIGYHIDFDREESFDSKEIVDRLVDTADAHKGKIVGFFADLDYRSFDEENSSEKINNQQETFRSFQLERLRNTLEAASRLDCPVQVRIEPGYKPCQQSPTPSSITGENDTTSATTSPTDGYSQAIRDLGTILLEASVHSWKVHLSSWKGKAEHLVALSGAFSSSSTTGVNDKAQHQQQKQHHLVFGFEGSLGFSKAVHLHESAFEVSPRNIVLETGGPGILPPIVAKHCGRNAFCHSGHIPFVAEELAKHLSKNPRNNTIAHDGTEIDKNTNEKEEINAEVVARWASSNTKALYRLP